MRIKFISANSNGDFYVGHICKVTRGISGGNKEKKEGKKTIMHEVKDTDRDKTLRKLIWFLIIVLVIVRVVTWFL